VNGPRGENASQFKILDDTASVALVPRSAGSAIISTWELCNGAFDSFEFSLSVVKEEISSGSWTAWKVGGDGLTRSR
jgi:hypothetical protein